eukprot:855323-Pelagomonas_calceolata.AAC.1
MGVEECFVIESVRLLGGPSAGVMLSLKLERVLLLGGSSVGCVSCRGGQGGLATSEAAFSMFVSVVGCGA